MSAFQFLTPVQIERNGNQVSLVSQDAFLLCHMEDSDVAINLRDAGDIRKAINNHDALVAALTEAQEFIMALLALTPDAAGDALMNNGEDVEARLKIALINAGNDAPHVKEEMIRNIQNGTND